MFRSVMFAAAVMVSLGGMAAPAMAAPCKDAKGKFTKCPPPAAVKGARCKDAKGKFAKCGSPGAVPMK